MLNNLRQFPIIGSFVTLLLMLPCISQAGGLYLNEFGTPSMGVAGAGTHAVASDASTSFHNPAGMTRIKDNEFMGTGGLLYSTVKFDPGSDTPIPGGDGGDAGDPAPIPISRWHNLSGSPPTTSSMTAGRCSEPWAGKTGVHLKMSTFPPIKTKKSFRATGRIHGSSPPESITARWTDGCCRLGLLTTPARWTRMIARRICPWIGRFVTPRGLSISGAIVFPPGRSSSMPITVRPR